MIPACSPALSLQDEGEMMRVNAHAVLEVEAVGVEALYP